MSGEIPDVPVVSPISGGIFEKRLIEKYVDEYGTDPNNGQPLTKDQLIDLKGMPSMFVILLESFHDCLLIVKASVFFSAKSS